MRLSPKLTLTLGFREESTSGWNEAHGRAANYTYPNGIISSQPTIGTSVYTRNRGTLLPQPRFGVAWSPLEQNCYPRADSGCTTICRMLSGIARIRMLRSTRPTILPNAAVSQLPLSRTAPVPAAARLVPGGVQPDLYTPTLISWSFRIQQELTANTALTVGYVGSHGYHELIGIDANEPFPVVCPASPCPANYPGNFPAGLANTPVPAGSYYVPTATRANPAIANTWTYFSEGSSTYNALQVDINHRFSGGFSLRGAYTWSKTIDDGDSLNATTSGGEPALASNPFNLRADRGLANFDVRHVGVVSAFMLCPLDTGGDGSLAAADSETRLLAAGHSIPSSPSKADFPLRLSSVTIRQTMATPAIRFARL